MFKELRISPGHDKNGQSEHFEQIVLHPHETCAVVGNTGSGKSRLIADIEQMAAGNTITKRTVEAIGGAQGTSDPWLIAHLAQTMRFVLDASVEEFIALHCRCRDKAPDMLFSKVLSCANKIASERIYAHSKLGSLSGGQSRALMIADISIVCDSPIVLIDEIENAGIDKMQALALLLSEGKLVLIVTHDPHTALLCSKRIQMSNGAIARLRETTNAEKQEYARLHEAYLLMQGAQTKLRNGEELC